MLKPRFYAYRDLGDYVVQFTLERPDRTRKVFSRAKLARHKWGTGGVREVKVEVKVFD